MIARNIHRIGNEYLFGISLEGNSAWVCVDGYAVALLGNDFLIINPSFCWKLDVVSEDAAKSLVVYRVHNDEGWYCGSGRFLSLTPFGFAYIQETSTITKQKKLFRTLVE